MQTNKKLNILIVTTEFLNNAKDGLYDGGIANEYFKFAKTLKEKGHNVIVLTARHTKYSDSEFAGIKVIEFNPRKHFKVLRMLKYLWLNVFRINNKYRNLREYLFFDGLNFYINQLNFTYKFDVIQFTSENNVAMCNIENIPYCIRIASYHKNFMQEYDIPLDPVVIEDERKMYQKARYIFGPSKYIANLIKNDLNLSQNINIIETPFLKSTDEVDNFYLNQISNKKYMLFFGTLGVLKGSFDIADIIYDVLDKYKDLNLVMVGKQVPYKGKEPYKEIRTKAKEYANRIIWFDKMQHKHLYPIIKNAEFCLMPSRTENFSNTCLEAMGFGKIVIGSSPYFNQIIDDDVNGFLCEAKNPQSLLQKIYQVMELSEDKKLLIQEKAYQRVCECSPEKMTTKLIEYYMNIISDWKNYKNKKK